MPITRFWYRFLVFLPGYKCIFPEITAMPLDFCASQQSYTGLAGKPWRGRCADRGDAAKREPRFGTTLTRAQMDADADALQGKRCQPAVAMHNEDNAANRCEPCAGPSEGDGLITLGVSASSLWKPRASPYIYRQCSSAPWAVHCGVAAINDCEPAADAAFVC